MVPIASQEASRENNDIPRQIRAVVATAANAKLLADREDSEIERLVATMIETQVVQNFLFCFLLED